MSTRWMSRIHAATMPSLPESRLSERASAQVALLLRELRISRGVLLLRPPEQQVDDDSREQDEEEAAEDEEVGVQPGALVLEQLQRLGEVRRARRVRRRRIDPRVQL